MARIDVVQTLCNRLAALGWRELLLGVTDGRLDIVKPTAGKLAAELAKKLAVIDRTVPGFEDFAPAGQQAITPSQPSLSLLYHALASPLVTRDHLGQPLRGFATPAELDALENYVFSVAPLALADLVKRNGAANVAVVVFSSQYRTLGDTVDGQHADLTFSRTGVARVGTSRPRYNPTTRGFWPEDEDNPHGIRVLPARFGAWIAVKKTGADARVSPILDNQQAQENGEAQRAFWIPVHKLFDGDDCVAGRTVQVGLAVKLFNLKIQRIHAALGTKPLPTGYPYVITDDAIGAWSTDPELGPGWLVPTQRPRLVEPAIVDGKPVTFGVTKDLVDVFAAVEPPGTTVAKNMEVRPAPAYVHGRTLVDQDRFTDLNDEPDVVGAMQAKPYEALHYVDFTGDGWVTADVVGLPGTVTVKAAYALVAAPDFFPASGQFALSEWSRSKEVPRRFADRLWNVDPTPLSETRLPANLQLPGNPFASADTTITAVVGVGAPRPLPSVWPAASNVLRSSSLPDDAAGVFAPGWDVSVDRLPGGGKLHLAAYGLGSPFPEDAKLCAALSTFWPAVAPDVFRTFATSVGNTQGTVAPLTDAEIGQTGSLPWDGTPGPRVVTENGVQMVELASFLNTDYVQQLVENRFSIRLTARVSAGEYEARILAISRVYSAVGNLSNIASTRGEWLVLSFQEVIASDPELQQAQNEAGAILDGPIYRAQLCRLAGPRRPVNARVERFPLKDLRSFFAAPKTIQVLTKRDGDLHWGKAPSE